MDRPDSNVVSNDMFTPNEVIDAVEIGDTSLEIVGYVEKISARSPDRKNFQFLLSNGQGKLIQVVAWNDLMKTVEEVVTTADLIIHLDKVLPRKPLKAIYNRGSVPWELVIQNCTVVHVLGTYVEQRSKVTVQYTEFDSARKIGGLIETCAYIRNNFHVVKTKRMQQKIGSITDGYYKLEVHVRHFSELDSEFKKGQFVKITGKIEEQRSGLPLLWIESMENIKSIKGKRLSILDLWNGYRVLPK